MRRIRVALVSPEIHRLGGTERSSAEAVERWGDRFDLTIYSMRVDGVDTRDARVRKVVDLPGPHLGRYIGWFLANRARRWTDVRSGPAPDVVASPGVNCLDADVVRIHVLFGRYWGDAKGRLGTGAGWMDGRARMWHRATYANLIRILESRLYRGSAVLAALTPRDAREIERTFGRPRGSVVAIPNGVDIATFSVHRREALRQEARERVGVSGDACLLLLVGNDAVVKGMDTALAALARLPQYFTLAIAGRLEPDEIQRLAAEAGVDQRVLPLPHAADPMRYYAAADLLIAPSRWETFNNPVIEAMASGLPVVVSVQAGVAEFLTDGREALLLDDPEDVGSLVDAVTRVTDDTGLTDSLVRHGLGFAATRSWDHVASATADLIEREATTPRVLVLAPEARGIGGIQRVTRSLAEALSESFGEDRVGVLSLYRGTEPIRGRVLRQGVVVRSGKVPLRHKLAFVADSAWTARRWRRRLAVVVTHPHQAPVGWLSRVISGAPYAVWCHGTEVWGRVSPVVASAIRRADVVFAPSRFTARAVEEVAGLRPGSVRVIPHPLPPIGRGERGSAPGRPRVLTVARLVPEHRYKGVDLLLRAWPKVRAEVDAELLVVGDGPDLAYLRGIALEEGVEDSVRFTGQVSDEQLAAAYGSATVFALPARFRRSPTPEGEGFGLVYAEAGAYGVPVVASPGGGVEDVVQDGVNGLFVDAGDPADIARGIVTLLTDGGLAKRLGDEGRRLATTELDPERFRTRIESLVRGELRPRGLVT